MIYTYQFPPIVRIIIISLFAIGLYSSCESKYSGPDWAQDAYWMMDKYATKYGKAHDMDLVNVGNFDEKRYTMLYGLWFRSYSNLTLQEGKSLATNLVSDFLQTLQNNQQALRYLEESRRGVFVNIFPEKITPQTVGIKIAFWDKNVQRPLPPYLAEITFYDNTFRYYQTDPRTQALVLIKEESYEEAIRQR